MSAWPLVTDGAVICNIVFSCLNGIKVVTLNYRTWSMSMKFIWSLEYSQLQLGPTWEGIIWEQLQLVKVYQSKYELHSRVNIISSSHILIWLFHFIFFLFVIKVYPVWHYYSELLSFLSIFIEVRINIHTHQRCVLSVSE